MKSKGESWPGPGLLFALALGIGCAGGPELSLESTQPPMSSEALPTLSLFEGWLDGPRMSFERNLGRWNPNLDPHDISPEDRQVLEQTLGSFDEPAMRAALLLCHSRDPQAAELLIARLQERLEGPDRNSDGAEVVAAATLAIWPAEDGFGVRLVELSIGERPHPDLEVRVECACSALARGRTTVTPFLLRILRAGTPAQATDPPDWTPKPTMAWSKSRAATALSRHLGIRVNFRADASYDDQLTEIARLAELLDADQGR